MRLRFWCLAIGSLALSTPLLACPSPESGQFILRSHPVDSIPTGAVQLQVTVFENEEFLRNQEGGAVTLPVERVIDGSFTGEQVTFSFQNGDSCDFFGGPGGGLFVVLFPARYAEGDLLLDEQGEPIFEAIRFNLSEDPKYTGVASTARFNEWFQPELDAQRSSCWRRGGKSQEAIEACMASDAPDELYQGMGRSTVMLVAGGLAALGFGALVWRRAAG